MPKATLVFNLPEENEEHKLALNAGRMYSCLWELDQFLRNKVKYESDSLSDAEIGAYKEYRKILHDFLEAHELVI